MILTADRHVGFLSKVERSCVRNKMQILSNRPRAVKPMDENSNVFFFLTVVVFFTFYASLYFASGTSIQLSRSTQFIYQPVERKNVSYTTTSEVVAIVS